MLLDISKDRNVFVMTTWH